MGVGIIFEEQNIDTLKCDSELLMTIHAGFVQAESESMSRNITWSYRKRFESGAVMFNYSKLLGYRKGENGQPEIVPEEAEVIRSIYDMFLSGMTLREIAGYLKSEGIKTKGGSTTWSIAVIQNILKNEKYSGDAITQKTVTIDCISKTRKKNTGEAPMYYIRDNHPAIIDRKTFNKVQTEMARRNSKRSPSDKATITGQGRHSRYALSDIMHCGECGTKYRRTIWCVKGEKIPVWRCCNRLDHGRKYCKDSPTIKESDLHAAIVRSMSQFSGDDYNSFHTAILRTIADAIGMHEDIGGCIHGTLEQALVVWPYHLQILSSQIGFQKAVQIVAEAFLGCGTIVQHGNAQSLLLGTGGGLDEHIGGVLLRTVIVNAGVDTSAVGELSIGNVVTDVTQAFGGTAVGGNSGRAGVAFYGIHCTAGIAGDNAHVVGDVFVSGGLKIDNITGLGCISTVGNGGTGVCLTFVLEPGQTGGRVGVAGDDGGGNARHIGAPGHKHGAPHILHIVPATVLSAVSTATDGAGKLRGGSAFLITDLGFCNVDNVRSLVTSKLHIGQLGIVFAGFEGGRSVVGQCGGGWRKHGRYAAKHRDNQTCAQDAFLCNFHNIYSL